MTTVRVALAQINPTVGDIQTNTLKICEFISRAGELGAELVVFPELAVTGYPPEDLLLKPHFIQDNMDALAEIQKHTKGISAVLGFVDRKESTNNLYNAAVIIHDTRLVHVYHKMHLPNYGVFDEHRYFKSGEKAQSYTIRDISLGVNICEDIWHDNGPAKMQALSGAEIVVNISASPYHMEKISQRETTIAKRAAENSVVVIYLNMVGGQDELVFDGGSLIADKSGAIIVRARQFEEQLIIADINIDGNQKIVQSIAKPLQREEEVYKALVLGTHDYVKKNGFSKTVIGLSGGVDSALVATVAADALGKENVIGVFMPSKYTSDESREDAYDFAKNLGIQIIQVPINELFDIYKETLSKAFKETTRGITEENLQARIRGNILMAFSNKFNWLVLTTGNKSEMSVGYATLYGDMAGGFAVIKDIPKTLVYEVCKWKNKTQGSAVIPERVLNKEPTAELSPGQKDTDTLPPYKVLDTVLKAYIEDDKSFEEIKASYSGCDHECIQNVIRMVDISEYKRRQSPPGIKITPRAFGRDRRFPITNKYRSC